MLGVVYKHRHVGLIGFGAVGRDVYTRLTAHGYRVTVLVRAGSSAARDAPPDAQTVFSVNELSAAAPQLVVEAAGQKAVTESARPILSAGISYVVVSTGALADPAVASMLSRAAESGGAKLIVASGAVGALDYLSALHGDISLVVTYTSRKPPAAWSQELEALGHNPGTLANEIMIFEGTAVEAARLYPRSLNSGMTIALAAGHAQTRVRVIADPRVTHNTHEIEANSSFGNAFLRFTNNPSPTNPRTSALTAASVVAAVERFFATVVF